MPSSRQFLEEGIDPTGDSCVSLSTLLQMFRASLPHTDIGYVISAEETALPNVTTYPELARFLVRGTSAGVATGSIYFWNGTSWQLIYGNLNLHDGTVTIEKLSTALGTANDIIRVNALGTAFEFISIVNAISNASLPIAKLSGTNPFNGLLVTESSVVAWMSYADLWIKLMASATPVGNNRDFLYINSGALAFGDINTILPNNIIEWRKIKYGTNLVPIISSEVIIDASLSGNFEVTLTGNVADVTIENMLDGQTLQILFLQDGVGGRTVNFTSSGIIWVGGTAPTITVTAEFGDVISVSKFNGKLIGVFAQNADCS